MGRSVPVVDAFRLGRVNPQSGSSSRPRPLLIKLSSVWDKRLILSCKYKLKEYSTPNLFLREDVPFEVRKARALARKVSREDAIHSEHNGASHLPPQSSSQQSFSSTGRRSSVTSSDGFVSGIGDNVVEESARINGEQS